MRARDVLKVLAGVDVVSGLALVAASSWFGDHVDVSTTIVRIVGLALAVLGVETYLLRERPVMAKVAIVAEAVAALAAVDVLLLADPTGTGAAMLVATAVYGVVAAVEVWLATRPRSLVTA